MGSLDARDFDGVRRFIRVVSRRFRRLDVVINNVGMMKDGLLGVMPTKSIHGMIALNVESTALVAREAARVMIRQKIGCIINISSVVGIRGFRGVAVYSATKAAVDGLTRGLARELGPAGVRVNSIAPGHLETDLSTMSDAQLDQIVRRTPLGRLPVFDDITSVAQFLASPAAGFITGQTIVVDGGLTC